MATVESYTTAKIDELIGATIVDVDVVGGELIFTKEDGTTLNIGAVGGGVTKVTAFPAVATDGDLIVHTGQVGDPMYKYTDGVWERQPRMGAQTVPAVKVYNSAAVPGTVPNNAITAIPFDTDEYDTDGIHDTSTNTTRLTVKTPGLYIINGVMSFGGQTPVAGQRELSIKRNGVSIYDEELQVNSAATDWTSMPFSTTVRLSAGDYIEICLYQNSGIPINYLGGIRWTAAMSWIGGAGQTVDDRSIPSAFVRRTAAQTGMGSVYAAIAWQQADRDNDVMWSAANPTRLTAKTPGLYRVTFQGAVEGEGSPSGFRFLKLMKNGSSLSPDAMVVSPNNGTNSYVEQVSVEIQLAVGDYVEGLVSQTSSNNASLQFVSSQGWMSATLLSSGNAYTARVRFSDVYAPAAQSIPTTTWTQASLTAAIEDIDAMKSGNDIVLNKTGLWMLIGSVDWSVSDVSGIRGTRFRVGASNYGPEEIYASVVDSADYNVSRKVIPAFVFRANAGDHAILQVIQTKDGGAINLNQARLQATYLGV